MRNTNLSKKFINASNMTLEELRAYNTVWYYPFMFGIAYTSDIAPDANNVVGIGVRDTLWAFSNTGRIFKSTAQVPDWTEIENATIKQKWLTLAPKISEMYSDDNYHPYCIQIGKFMYISGGFQITTAIAETTTILTGAIGPAKKRWIPVHNITDGKIYFCHINTKSTEITSNNLSIGNYIINVGYQTDYGVGI